MSVFALDPLLDKIDLGVFLAVVLKVVVAFALLMVAVMFMIWFERKIIADMQNRIGPNRAGPFGLLQTLADGIKLFFKEDLVPERSEPFVFKLAPYLSLVPAFLTFCVVPIGGHFADRHDGTISLAGHRTFLQLADPPIGLLLVLAMSSLAVYGVMLAGWSSGSKYPLLGSVRASAQMISYEAALGMSVAAVALVSSTLSTHGMVISQGRAETWNIFQTLRGWNIVATGFVPFVIFLIAATAELNRPPFDLVEAEQELVGGFHTEYSSIRFALFYLAEFMNTVTMSGIIVTLFLGGPLPLVPIFSFLPGWLEGIVWFLIKLLGFLFTYVWFRATLPRLRYDQLMNLGWKVLIPLSFGWFIVLAGLRLGRDHDWETSTWIIAGLLTLAVAGVCWLMLTAALDVARRNREAGRSAF
ncbi:MAG: NADH-quinone oxidoreductase subunit NuoH [Acidimicrobiia bacterium]